MWRCRGFAKIAASEYSGRARSWSGLASAAKACVGIVAGGLVGCAAVAYGLERSVVEAAHLAVIPPEHPWSFNGALASLDHSALRRGWQVYKNVCSGCHSLKYVRFRDLVNVCMSDEEAREVAASYEVRDGPDEVGEYFMRPGKLNDCIPDPYPNEEAARAANEGALPVDLSFVVNARHHGPDYIFGLLTGYAEPPAGLELREGQAFNAYFDGGAIGMGEILQDGLLDYDDGTPATRSQMAKDISEFLTWTSNQDWEERKLVCFRGLLISIILYALVYPLYRQRMAHIKNTKLCFIPRTKKGC